MTHISSFLLQFIKLSDISVSRDLFATLYWINFNEWLRQYNSPYSVNWISYVIKHSNYVCHTSLIVEIITLMGTRRAEFAIYLITYLTQLSRQTAIKQKELSAHKIKISINLSTYLVYEIIEYIKLNWCWKIFITYVLVLLSVFVFSHL